MYQTQEEIEREDIPFRKVCSKLHTQPSFTSKPKKPLWECIRCGNKLISKERLDTHMNSRNCKRLRDDDDELLEPHEAIGCNLKECLEIYKKLKDKNFNDDKIL